MISLQLLPQSLRRLPQPEAGAAEVQGDPWVEHVAQMAEDDAHLVTAEPREHPDNVAHQSCTSAPHSLLLVQRDEVDFDRVLRQLCSLGGVGRRASRRHCRRHRRRSRR
eukprot:scaffold25511_cov60-Phaeocystis_antarctica.AAC.3